MMLSTRRQRGGTLVEAALIILPLFIFVFAIFELGRAYNVYQVMTNAAREGARFSVAPCPQGTTSCTYGPGNLPTSTDVQSYVADYLNTASVQGATIAVDQAYSQSVGVVPENFTKVTVTVPYSFVFFPWSVTMSTQAVMRNENN